MEIRSVLEKNISRKISKGVMKLINVIRRDNIEGSWQIDIREFQKRWVLVTTVWYDTANNRNILLGTEVRTRSCKGINDKVMYSKVNGEEKIEIIKS